MTFNIYPILCHIGSRQSLVSPAFGEKLWHSFDFLRVKIDALVSDKYLHAQCLSALDIREAFVRMI